MARSCWPGLNAVFVNSQVHSLFITGALRWDIFFNAAQRTVDFGHSKTVSLSRDAVRPMGNGSFKSYRRLNLSHTACVNFIETPEMLQNDIPMLLQNSHSDEHVEVGRKQHAEEEEEVGGVQSLEVLVELRVEKLAEMVESEQLESHAGLVAEKVAFHSLHEADEAPKRYRVILFYSVDWCKEIRHALHVTKVAVVFVVRQQHILHLLKMNIGAGLSERRIRIRVRDVFAGEEWDVAICAMDILFYRGDGAISKVYQQHVPCSSTILSHHDPLRQVPPCLRQGLHDRVALILLLLVQRLVSVLALKDILNLKTLGSWPDRSTLTYFFNQVITWSPPQNTPPVSAASILKFSRCSFFRCAIVL
ncbi:RabGAP/TBC [Hortaea werneckii]|nr:RabGAP/TBC [Hortaea werneckii]